MLMLLKRMMPKNCSRPVESNYYLVKFGDIVDVVFDVIDES